jgi:hypothetical protein
VATVEPILATLTDDLNPLRARIGLNTRFKVLSLAMKRPSLVLFSAAFTSGLLLGWLIIGWWLWPVEWKTSYNPDSESEDYQQMLVTWAANRYWQTGDATQVQKAFANWKQDDLVKLLVTIQRQTPDVETRRRLVALTDALHLPVSEFSLTDLIFSQPGIVLGILLSTLPMLAALAFVTVPRIRKRYGVLEEIPGEATPPAESLDELLADVEAGEQTAVPGEETQEEEKKEETPVEEEAGEQSSGLGDLASLFEEEDTSINVLEAFCKGMPDIGVEELLTMGANIARQLHLSNAAG